MRGSVVMSSRSPIEPDGGAKFETQKQKTRREGRVFVDTHETRATAYPARIQRPGRRAREVIPAAMRALERFAGERCAAFMSDGR
jgi:hypothetical protein